jgi:hypothetical protein
MDRPSWVFGGAVVRRYSLIGRWFSPASAASPTNRPANLKRTGRFSPEPDMEWKYYLRLVELV